MMSVFLRGSRLILSAPNVCARLFQTNARVLCPMKIGMPSLSPTMDQGTIVTWHKKEGDEIVPGDLICDVQTDKAVVGMEFEEEGVLAKIVKPEGSVNKVGDLIGILATPDEDWKEINANADTYIASLGSESSEN